MHKSNEYMIVGGTGGICADGLSYRCVVYKLNSGHLVSICDEGYQDSQGSRLAYELRRDVAKLSVMSAITISPNAPPWANDAELDRKPNGLTSILAYDRKPSRELWYQVTTPQHRATIYLRGQLPHAPVETSDTLKA